MTIAVRIAVSLIAPFVALYLMISFVSWNTEFSPGAWEEGSRAMYLYVYVCMAGGMYAILTVARMK